MYADVIIFHRRGGTVVNVFKHAFTWVSVSTRSHPRLLRKHVGGAGDGAVGPRYSATFTLLIKLIYCILIFKKTHFERDKILTPTMVNSTLSDCTA